MQHQVSCDLLWPDVQVERKQAAAVEEEVQRRQEREPLHEVAEVVGAPHKLVRVAEEVQRRLAQQVSGLFRQKGKSRQWTPCRYCYDF